MSLRIEPDPPQSFDVSQTSIPYLTTDYRNSPGGESRSSAHGEGLHSVRRPSLRHRSANIGTTKTSAPDPTAPARSARHARSPDAAMSKKRVQRVCDGALCCPLCNIRTGTTNVFVFRPHRTSRPSDQPGCSRRATPVASQPICRPVRLRHKLSRVPLSQPRCPFRSKE